MFISLWFSNKLKQNFFSFSKLKLTKLNNIYFFISNTKLTQTDLVSWQETKPNQFSIEIFPGFSILGLAG